MYATPPPTNVDGTTLANTNGVLSVMANGVGIAQLAAQAAGGAMSGGTTDAPAINSTFFLPLSGMVGTATFTEAQSQSAPPVQVALFRLTVVNVANTAAGGSSTWTVRKDGADATGTLVVAGGLAAGTITRDTAHSDTVATTSKICLKLTTGGTAPTSRFVWQLGVQPA